MDYFFLIPLSAVIALVFAWFFYKSMMKNPEGNDKMKK